MILYLDMDDCITDFDQAVRDLGADAGLGPNATEDAKLRMYKAINQAGEDFWANMKWLPEGKKLWALVKPYKPTLLSSPGEFIGAESGKQIWVNRELPGISLFLDTEKWRFAERGAILIDDMPDNIEAWQMGGGIGILHRNFEETKQKLEEVMNMPQVRVTLADLIRKVASLFDPTKDFPKLSKLLSDYDLKPEIRTVFLKAQTKARITDDDVEKVRTSLKSIADLEERKMLQSVILKPLQILTGKLTPSHQDNLVREDFIAKLEELASMRGQEEKGLTKTRQKMREQLTKGTPPSQVSPSTQKYQP